MNSPTAVQVKALQNPYHICTIGVSHLYVEGLRRILDRRVFRIGENVEGINQAAKFQSAVVPNALLINAARRPLPTAATVARLHEDFPGCRLVLIEEAGEEERIQQAVELDLDGYLLETIEPLAFPKALELILMGERVFPVAQMRPVLRRDHGVANHSFEELSESQMRVVALLAKAYPNKVIARELGLSESTVKVHVKAILRKTGARNRTDIALLARGFEAPLASDLSEVETRHSSHESAGTDSTVLDLYADVPLLHQRTGRRFPTVK